MAETGFHSMRPELLWFLRHRDALARWPILPEPWAQRIEERRHAENPAERRETTGGRPAGR
jgi:hypothetical protein